MAHNDAYTEITAILGWFYIYKVVSEYTKSILACMENTLKEYKRIWRIRQEYFAVHIWTIRRLPKNWAYLGEFSTKTKKNSDPKSPFYTCSKSKKTISRYCPFNFENFEKSPKNKHKEAKYKTDIPMQIKSYQD